MASAATASGAIAAAARITPASFIKPAYADTSVARQAPAAAPAASKLPESTILDRWKDTGQPLR